MLQKSGTLITSNNLTEYFLLLSKVRVKGNILILLGKNLYSKLIPLTFKFLRSKNLHYIIRNT